MIVEEAETMVATTSSRMKFDDRATMLPALPTDEAATEHQISANVADWQFIFFNGNEN